MTLELYPRHLKVLLLSRQSTPKCTNFMHASTFLLSTVPAALREQQWMLWPSVGHSSSQRKNLTVKWRSEQRTMRSYEDATMWLCVAAPPEISTPGWSRMSWRKRGIWNFWGGDQWVQSHAAQSVQSVPQRQNLAKERLQLDAELPTRRLRCCIQM